MKTIIRLVVAAALACPLLAQTPAPATPIPQPLIALPTPAPVPKYQVATVTIPAPQLQINLNAIPATPQSLLQLFATLIPLPAGVAPAQIKQVRVAIGVDGSALVSVQYSVP